MRCHFKVITLENPKSITIQVLAIVQKTETFHVLIGKDKNCYKPTKSG